MIGILLFLLLLPFSLPAKTVAVVVLQHPAISPVVMEKFQAGVVRELPKPLTIVRPTQEDIKGLESLLQEELQQAWQAFYHLDLETALRLTAGRTDPKALVLAAMIAHSRGDETGERLALETILMKDPNYQLSSHDFPPQIVDIFRKLPHPEPGRHVLTTKLGNIDLALTELPQWEGILGRWRQKIGWDEVLMLSLEPIGWNYKATATRLSTQLEKNHMVELKNLRELSQAAKILASKAYFVDSPSNIQ